MDIDIYARANPQQKLDLVNALRAQGHVVAVTGDGVNDAPALHNADIGVAMGRSGTEVARQASDLVITDDNLATVIHAVQEGRGIYDNIRKVVEYLVAANISEILVVLVALILFPELGVPLLPLQLLWINLITDGFPAIALGVDPVNPHLMEAPPRRVDDPLLNGSRLRRLLARGAALAAACMGALVVARYAWDEPWAHARMTMFTTLAISQLAYSFAVHTAWRGGGLRATLAGTFSNRWLLLGAGGGLLLQVLALSWEPTRDLLGGASLSPREWGLVAVASILPSLGILMVESLALKFHVDTPAD
jgi:Ca2+-transporting ATPase